MNCGIHRNRTLIPLVVQCQDTIVNIRGDNHSLDCINRQAVTGDSDKLREFDLAFIRAVDLIVDR
jgi:hypothetical protein